MIKTSLKRTHTWFCSMIGWAVCRCRYQSNEFIISIRAWILWYFVVRFYKNGGYEGWFTFHSYCSHSFKPNKIVTILFSINSKCNISPSICVLYIRAGESIFSGKKATPIIVINSHRRKRFHIIFWSRAWSKGPLTCRNRIIILHHRTNFEFNRQAYWNIVKWIYISMKFVFQFLYM